MRLVHRLLGSCSIALAALLSACGGAAAARQPMCLRRPPTNAPSGAVGIAARIEPRCPATPRTPARLSRRCPAPSRLIAQRAGEGALPARRRRLCRLRPAIVWQVNAANAYVADYPNVSWPNPLPPAGSDAYGIYWLIDPAVFRSDATGFGFIVQARRRWHPVGPGSVLEVRRWRRAVVEVRRCDGLS